MARWLTATCFFVFAFQLLPFAEAENPLQSIEIKELGGILTLTIPLQSFQKGDHGTFVVIGAGQLEQSLQKLTLEFGPNTSRPRKGVTHTEKSCNMAFDEGLFRVLAKQLAVSPLPSSLKLKAHSFDLLEVEGSVDDIGEQPVEFEILDLADDDFYSEWHLAIDVREKRVVLSEKNSEYRNPFVKTFLR